jgi:plastocyanin
VTWTNTGVTHTVTADKGLLDSGMFKSGETFLFTFARGGTFTYHCAIHSSMRGTVTVTPQDDLIRRSSVLMAAAGRRVARPS